MTEKNEEDLHDEQPSNEGRKIPNNTDDLAKNLQDSILIADDIYLEYAPQWVKDFYMTLDPKDKQVVQKSTKYMPKSINFYDENGVLLWEFAKENIHIQWLPSVEKIGVDNLPYTEYETSSLPEIANKKFDYKIRQDTYDTYMNVDWAMAYAQQNTIPLHGNPFPVTEAIIKRMPAGDYDPNKFCVSSMQFFRLLGAKVSWSYSTNDPSNDRKYDTGEVGFLSLWVKNDTQIWMIEADADWGRIYSGSRNLLAPFRPMTSSE